GEPVQELVGFGGNRGEDWHLDGAERQAVTDLETKPIEQYRVDRGAGLAADRLVERGRLGQADATHERIGFIHALEFNERLLAAVRPTRHGAHAGRFAEATLPREPGALGLFGRSVRTGQRDGAPQPPL